MIIKHFLSVFALCVCCYSVFAQDTTILTFDVVEHTGGNTVTETFNLPDDLSNYNQILMHINLACPTGGCDPWDRFANIKVVKEGEKYEIGRYVTPYGNDWCDWTIDVSDYRELLTGTVEMESHIETWQNGWLFTAELEYKAGMPSWEYVTVENIWVEGGLIYGDTIWFSIDLPEQTIPVASNVEEAILRVVNTGHGQGNTMNAAEFSQQTHKIMVNGNEEFSQFLWKDDCGQNPCSPQGGTWTLSRAGWCPGQDVKPDDYNLTPFITPGSDLVLDYVLEPYFNNCSPWNPDCDDGVTCSECNYNSDSHTQPTYKISVQLITRSNTAPNTTVNEIKQERLFTTAPNPSEGIFNIKLNDHSNKEIEISVYNISGNKKLEQLSYLNGGQLIELDLGSQINGMYLLEIKSVDQISYEKLILVK